MSTIDIETINTLVDNLSVNGQPMPYWLEEAVRKSKFDKAQTVIADHLESKAEAEKLKEQQQPYEKRVNALFADFDLSIPEDFKRYKTTALEKSVDDTKENIKRFASDMHQLVELSGDNQILRDKAVNITANLLDRLKNSLGLDPEERKKLEGKSIEEITAYFELTRKDQLGKLNEVITGYRQEVNTLLQESKGKSVDEIVILFKEKLNTIQLETEDSRIDSKRIAIDHSKYNTSLNEVIVPMKHSSSVSQEKVSRKLSTELCLD